MNGLEALKSLQKWLDDDYLENGGEEDFKSSEEYKAVEKELKALEIIKEKRVNVEQFMIILHDYKYRSLEEQVKIYNSQCARWNVLSRDEFNLLKEVLE